MNDNGTKPNYHTQALSRGISVLRAVARSGPVTLQGLHDSTELPKPTLIRLLTILVAEDLVERIDEQPSFEIGGGFSLFADALDRVVDAAQLAQPYLEQLGRDLGQTGNLGVLDGEEIVHVCVVESDRPVRYSAKTGDRDPAWQTGIGLVLLAHLPLDEAMQLVPSDPLPRLTPFTRATQKEMSEALEQTRRQGWGFDDQQGAEGLRCLAVPVMEGERCIAAVSVSGPAAEIDEESRPQTIERLQRTAKQMAADEVLMRQLRMKRDHNVLQGRGTPQGV